MSQVTIVEHEHFVNDFRGVSYTATAVNDDGTTTTTPLPYVDGMVALRKQEGAVYVDVK